MNLLISAVTWDAALKAGLPQAALADHAAALGCQGVEFRQYWKDFPAEAPQAVAALARHGLVATYACNEGLLADTQEAALTMITAAGDDLAAAAALGAKVLRLNLAAGPFDPAFLAAPWWREAIDWLLARAERLGIPVAVENGPDPAKSDIALFAALFAAVPSPWLRLTFDTGNWLYADARPEDALDRLASHVGYVHLKDIIKDPAGLKHSHPGTGAVDVRGLARRLDAGGYSGYMVLEFPGGDDPAGRVRASRAHLAG